jgi:hypothetical protein
VAPPRCFLRLAFWRLPLAVWGHSRARSSGPCET